VGLAVRRDAGNIMRSPVLAHGGALPQKCLLLLIALILIVSPVMANIQKEIPSGSLAVYNKSFVIPTDGSTPFDIWILSITAGVLLVLLSLMSGLFQNGEEGLVSILAWIPISYAIFTSFSVDMLNGVGVSGQYHTTIYEYVMMESHTVYHFDVISVCLYILLAFAIGNTYRIWVSQKKLREYSEMEL